MNKQQSENIRRAIYPGSFDFLTNGHMDMIQRSSRMFDHVIVAVAHNSSKNGFFTPEERVDVLRQATESLGNIEIHLLEGLTVDYALRHHCKFILRGLRAVSDFEFELQIAIMNHELQNEIETIFLAADPENIFLSSRVVKDVWNHGGDVSRFVPAACLKALESKKPEFV